MNIHHHDTAFAPRFSEFQALVQQPEPALDLGAASLHLGFLLYPQLDTAGYLRKLDALADEARPLVAGLSSSRAQAEGLAGFLFETCGFMGNEEDYYDVRNSLLSDVLDRRLGIPITLSVVLIEVARRLGIACEGVGMPGHFLVRHLSPDGMLVFDPFHGGRLLRKRDCLALLGKIYGTKVPLKPEYFRPVTKRRLLGRMLSNLKNIYVKEENWSQALRVIEMILQVQPSSWIDVRDRGLIHFHLKHWSAAANDLARYLHVQPEDENLKSLQEHLAEARKELAQWN